MTLVKNALPSCQFVKFVNGTADSELRSQCRISLFRKTRHDFARHDPHGSITELCCGRLELLSARTALCSRNVRANQDNYTGNSQQRVRDDTANVVRQRAEHRQSRRAADSPTSKQKLQHQTAACRSDIMTCTQARRASLRTNWQSMLHCQGR